MKIRNNEYAKKLIIFDGLQFGEQLGKDIRYHPSDVDFIIDLIRRQGLLIIAEFKYETTPELTQGQRIMMESIAEMSRPEYCVVCLHLVHKGAGDEQGNIIAKDAVIEQWYSNRTCMWLKPDKELTLGEYIAKCFAPDNVSGREKYIQPFTAERAKERVLVAGKTRKALEKIVASIVIAIVSTMAAPMQVQAPAVETVAMI